MIVSEEEVFQSIDKVYFYCWVESFEVYESHFHIV